MNKVILLVEENVDDEKLTLRALREANVANEINVVRDGAVALEYLFGKAGGDGSDARALPSVVLLELNLPVVAGVEVLRRIRTDERTRLLPVVVLTASKEEEDVLRSYSLGANAFVRKPVDFDDFVTAAKTLGLFWLLVNESAPVR